MSKTNILLIVWDACRYDTALECAPTLRELSANNLSFENAIAPAPWTLPSHVSLLTGLMPHEHQTYSPGDTPDDLSALDQLATSHRTYAVSGNPIFSSQSGFHRFFNKFYYTTPTIYAKGLNATDIFELLGNTGRQAGKSSIQSAIKLLSDSIYNRHTFKSLANIFGVAVIPTIKELPVVGELPHPRFNSHDVFSYSPSRNTELIRKIVQDQRSEERPFFLIANYMDTHRPYAPPVEYQRRHLNRQLSYNEIDNIDKGIADTWKHLERCVSGDINPEKIDLLRSLYKGTVNSADDHLREILDILEKNGLREDTLVIVTADHGEALGEKDEMGYKRVGHQMTVSDHVLRVPLVVAHPNVDTETVSEYTSLVNIAKLLKSDLAENLSSNWLTNTLVSSDNVVISEYPAKGITDIYQKYPKIPEEILKFEVSEHTVAGYMDDWKLIKSTSGHAWASQSGEHCDVGDVPQRLRDDCETRLKSLSKNKRRTEIDESSISQLENLGYM